MRRSRAPLIALVLLFGCATEPLPERRWVEVRTPHFEIVSSLGAQETADLQNDAELFHTAAEFVLGMTFPGPPVPTRIYAFDGRGFVRPFDVRGEPGYFLPSLREATIVLRTGDGWRLDATVELRHAYVHYLLRNRGGFERPLWFDEGTAEFLGTVEVRDGRVDLGRFHRDHVKLLRDQPWIPLIRILQAEDLEDWGPRRRSVFRAESWAFVHYLNLGRGRPGQSQAQLARYFGNLEQGMPHEPAIERAFGVSSSDLDRELQDFVRSDHFAEVAFRLQQTKAPDASAPRTLTRAEVLTRLGWLSISLARADQAERYFEQAIADDPQNARAHAGLGSADTLRERWEAAAAHLRRALDIAPGDALNQIEAASYYRRRAAATEDVAARASFAALARHHYGESFALRDALPEAYADYGSTFLLPGQESERAIEPLEEANQLLGSSEEIKLRLGQLYLELGRPGQARRQATAVFSRTHSPATRDTARELIDRIDASIAAGEHRKRPRELEREILTGPEERPKPAMR